MVDFKKLLGNEEITPEIDPLSIFDYLDKESTIEGLRDSQKHILNKWHEDFRDQRDVIVKLPTGQGKTFIGLIMLQSILNENKGPVVYLCPNNHLVTQTVKQARSLGIKTTQFGTNNEIPADFLNSQAILVTTCKRIFNGKSKFGVVGSYREDISLGAILMDDAHKCLEIIRESFSIRIPKRTKTNNTWVNNPVYDQLFSIFEPCLSTQGKGTCLDIREGSNYCFLAVPFWTWQDNVNDVLGILSEHKDENEILFAWDLIKNNLDQCTCIISGDKIEISPRVVPINLIPSFEKASKRFFMSATLTEDAFLIKDLGIDSESIRKPLVYGNLKYSGERLILFPTKVDTNLDRVELIDWVSEIAKKNGDFGVVAIVPSKNKTVEWISLGGKLISSENIVANLENLRKSTQNGTANEVLALMNAYDGVDLPDNVCRILVLDSLPSYTSLIDRYVQLVRSNSESIRRQLAQRIEQGMGRAIRGSSDWCIVIVIGDDLTHFFSERRKIEYLSKEAQMQIEIGENLASLMKTEGGALANINETIQQSLSRDIGWKEYYKKEMAKLELNEMNEEYLDDLILERDAEIHYKNNQVEKSIYIIDRLIDKSDSPDDIGWYLQLQSTYLYQTDITASMDAQLKAFELNPLLFKPEKGVRYSKLNSKGKDRASRIQEFIYKQESKNSMILEITNILNKIGFSLDTDRFEEGIKQLGVILGFLSDRPEKYDDDGPDNLWNVYADNYWIIECKSGVYGTREFISKRETGQMHNSIHWFKETYEEYTGQPVFIHPATLFATDAHLADASWVINKELLESLKKNTRDFYNSFTSLDRLSDEIIMEKLREFNLDQGSLRKYLLRVENMS